MEYWCITARVASNCRILDVDYVDFEDDIEEVVKDFNNKYPNAIVEIKEIIEEFA
jgi:hypothetical protein